MRVGERLRVRAEMQPFADWPLCGEDAIGGVDAKTRRGGRHYVGELDPVFFLTPRKPGVSTSQRHLADKR